MIHDLTPYPAYKDSGVPWLGDVPAHWVVQRGKWLFRGKKEINSNQRCTNVLSLTLRGVVNNDPDDPEGLVPKDYGTYQFFAKDDLVFKLIDLENLRTSRVGLVHEDGIMSPAYVRFIPTHDGSQRFFFHQYFDLYQRGVFNQLGAGVRATLGAKDLLEIPIALPPLREQAAIVRFLDHVDRRIRRYIRAKQKLIKLLEEQKQAIIHRAVTRGLDQNVRLKPSGVEWLGDVPEHWGLLPLKRACSLLRDGTHLPPPRQAEGFPLLSVRNIMNGRLVRREDDSFISAAHFKELCRSFTPTRDDVLLAIVGATLGKAAIVPEMDPFQIQRSLAVFRPRENLLDSRFLAAFLEGPAFQRALWTTVAFSAQPGIYLSVLGAFRIPLPTLAEQQTIIKRLEGSTVAATQAIDRAQREIDLIREYRTRLIADVVTGKFDVCEAAARLPNEAEEPEAPDDVEALTEDGDLANDITVEETEA
jgi:type I restriction enzyme S subunit